MKHNQVRQVVFPVITAMIWGTSFVAQSTSTEHVGAYTFNAARSFVGFLALLVVIQIFDAVNRRKQASASPSQEQSAPVESRKTLIIGGICCGFALALACNLQQTLRVIKVILPVGIYHGVGHFRRVARIIRRQVYSNVFC